MMNTPNDTESRRGALLLGGVGPHGTATGGGLAPVVASSSPTTIEEVSSMAYSIDNATAETVVPKDTQRSQAQHGGVKARTLEKRLLASSTTYQPTQHEATIEDAYTRFFKYLQQTYDVSKSLDEEVAAASNTKREIKTLITKLSDSVKGLKQWGRHMGGALANCSNRGTQTEQDHPGLLPTTKKHPKTKTTEALTGTHTTKTASARPALVDLATTQDRSRSEIPAALEALRQTVKAQGEVIAKLVDKMDKQQEKPRQLRQRDPSSRQEEQTEQHQQQPLIDTQDPPLSDQADNWEIVSRRTKKRERRGPTTRIRPDAIIVKADNMTYADMLKKIRASRDMEGVSGNIHCITKTRDGHLRLVLNRDSAEPKNLQTAIKTAIGHEANCNRLTDMATVEIRDADEEATNEEITQALETHTKGHGTAKIVSKRRTNRGTQVITASIPTTAINTLLKTRLRIGFVNCRVKRMVDIQKCFRCQGFGHTRRNCTNDERSDHCWNCGKEGHKSLDCAGKASCLLCKEEESSDHRLGSHKCHAFKRAVEAAKQRK